MAIKIYKPTSPARRHSSVNTSEGLTKKRPEKSLIKIKKQKAGRNNQGKITVRHRGGGEKRYLRNVDSRRIRFDMPALVTALEYDPGRSANIALIQYEDGEKAYILAPSDLKVGDSVMSSESKIDIKAGNRMPLGMIPAGIAVHDIEITPGKGGQMVRSAGLGAQIMASEGGFVNIKLPSSEVRRFLGICMATVGAVGNSEHRHIRWGKAGRMRHKGWRPTVRGKAMNPVDHPHGGGEGNQPIGLKGPKTPQGKPALGLRTRNKKKYSNKLIIKRRSK